jgi:hypothetical protein
MQVGDGHAEEWVNLKFQKKKSEDQLHAEQLETLLPASILTPTSGLKEIKMVKPFTKFPPCLKTINVRKICPYPGDEVMARIKDNKRVQRASQKRKLVVLAASSETTDE